MIVYNMDKWAHRLLNSCLFKEVYAPGRETTLDESRVPSSQYDHGRTHNPLQISCSVDAPLLDPVSVAAPTFFC